MHFVFTVVIKLEGGTDADINQLLDGGVLSGSSADGVAKADTSSGADTKPAKSEPMEAGSGESESKAAPSKKRKQEDDDGEEAGEDNNGENGKEQREEGAAAAAATGSDSESGAYTDSDSSDSSSSSGDDESTKKKRKKKTKKRSTADTNGKTSATSNGGTVTKQLHRTASIFMRNLAPSVSKQDLEALCKDYEGFKRVALSDPAPERGFFRRGWCTFEAHVDVKKICWAMLDVKVKECNPGAILNRELTTRIRTIPNLSSHHKPVVKNNIRLAMAIVNNMDKKWNLWQDETPAAAATQNGAAAEETPTTTAAATTEANASTATATAAADADATKPPASGEATTTAGGEKEKAAAAAAAAVDENARLEEEAFSKLKPHAPLYLPHKVSEEKYFEIVFCC